MPSTEHLFGKWHLSPVRRAGVDGASDIRVRLQFRVDTEYDRSSTHGSQNIAGVRSGHHPSGQEMTASCSAFSIAVRIG